MKRKLPIIAIILIFVIGLGVLAYPLVSAMINNFTARSDAEAEIKHIEQMESSETTELFAEAEKYNKSLLSDIILTDPFDEEAYEAIGANYPNTFNVNSEGLICYIDIPKINVYLPVYHGTSAEVLERGAGHLDNTAFPIGGESTHSVISAHSAFPTETFFDYLTDMEKGDAFYIHVLNRVLKYEVDDINVVLPNDTTKLNTIRGEDHVTLLTCTPYSINTHRLLVRGKRVPYDPNEGIESTSFNVDNNFIYILGYRISFLTAGIIIAAFILIVFGIVFYFTYIRKRRKKLQRVKKDGDESG